MRLDGLSSRESKFKYRSCLAKVRFEFEPHVPPWAVRAYHCPFCKGYHLTRKQLGKTGSNKTFALDDKWPIR